MFSHAILRTSHIKRGRICPKPSGQTFMPDKAIRLMIADTHNGYKAFERHVWYSIITEYDCIAGDSDTRKI